MTTWKAFNRYSKMYLLGSVTFILSGVAFIIANFMGSARFVGACLLALGCFDFYQYQLLRAYVKWAIRHQAPPPKGLRGFAAARNDWIRSNKRDG